MQILNIFHVLIAIAMVAFVLIQRGPGATAGAAFGSGASGTVFGSRGAGSFLSRTTWILATLFCLISLTMAVVVSRNIVTTETDVGVVASQQPAQQEALDSVPALDLPPVDDSGQGSDLPELDTAPTVSGPGDLPPLKDEQSSDTDEGESGSGG